MSAHIADECAESIVACGRKDCSISIYRKDIQKHKLECQYEIVECDQCSFEFLRLEQPSHNCIKELKKAFIEVKDTAAIQSQTISILKEKSHKYEKAFTIVKEKLETQNIQ